LDPASTLNKIKSTLQAGNYLIRITFIGAFIRETQKSKGKAGIIDKMKLLPMMRMKRSTIYSIIKIRQINQTANNYKKTAKDYNYSFNEIGSSGHTISKFSN
jgi:hypothetical protein